MYPSKICSDSEKVRKKLISNGFKIDITPLSEFCSESVMKVDNSL